MPRDTEFYDRLSVRPDASPQEIRRSYLDLSREWHPDRLGRETDEYRNINEAYHCLNDPESRRVYDEMGTAGYTLWKSGNGPSSRRNFKMKKEPEPTPINISVIVIIVIIGIVTISLIIPDDSSNSETPNVSESSQAEKLLQYSSELFETSRDMKEKIDFCNRNNEILPQRFRELEEMWGRLDSTLIPRGLVLSSEEEFKEKTLKIQALTRQFYEALTPKKKKGASAQEYYTCRNQFLEPSK